MYVLPNLKEQEIRAIHGQGLKHYQDVKSRYNDQMRYVLVHPVQVFEVLSVI